MKILVFTDPHGSISALKKVASMVKKQKPDILICPGDLSIFGQALEELINKVDKFKVKTLMLHGNHEDEEELKILCSYSENVEFFHRKAQIIDGVLFMGYGGGGFSLEDKEFKRLSSAWKKRYSKKKLKAKVLFTHAPPYGTKVDVIVGGSHVGNKDIKRFIVDFKPDFAFCGHIHDSNGQKQKLGKTLIMNSGPFGKIFRI